MAYNRPIHKIGLLNKIGRGSFGVVHKALWDDKVVAVKVFDAVTELTNYEVEFFQMSRVRHPNIINIFAMSMDKQSKYLIMECAQNDSLHNFLHGAEQTAYTIEQAMEWALQCAEGVAFLHSLTEPIVLLDMSPFSLLLTHDYRTIKISNICTSLKFSKESDITKKHWPYMAPELFTGIKYTDKCDVYSWAIIVCEMLTRKIPTEEFNKNCDIQNRISTDTRPSLPDQLIRDFSILLNSSWHQFEIQRPSMSAVVSRIVKIYSICRKKPDGFKIDLPLTLIDSESLTIGCDNQKFGITATWLGVDVLLKQFSSKNIEAQTFQIMSSELSRIHHPNIIELLGISTLNTMKYIVCEHPGSVSLSSVIYGDKKPGYLLENAVDWALHCARGIAYLHNMKPEPRMRANLNPQFLMLVDNRKTLKICDFTTDIHLMDYKTEVCAYMAPEVLEGWRYSQKSDVFSWAILLWELLKREKPYKKEDDISSIKKNCLIGLPLKTNWPELIKDCLLLCWNKRPNNRPSAVLLCKRMEKTRKRLDFKQSGSFLDRVLPNNNESDLATYIFPYAWGAELKFEQCIKNSTFGRISKANWWMDTVAVRTFSTKMNEVTINSRILGLSRVSHQNIINIFGIAFSANVKVLITEFAENGSLHDFLHVQIKQDYSWWHAFDWAHQCASALAYLHNMKLSSVLQPRLNSANLLLTKQGSQLKIYKFSFEVAPATNAYAAPELFETNPNYTEKCDVFSWGTLIWEILNRKQPNSLVLKTVKRQETLRADWPESIKALILSCWQTEPNARPCMADADSMIFKIKQSDIAHKNAMSYLKKKPTTQYNMIDCKTTNADEGVPSVAFKEITIGKVLGRGAYGIVHKAKWGNRMVAVKELDTRTVDRQEAYQTEVDQLTRISHRNIIKLFATSIDKYNKFLIMEYAENDSLDHFLHHSEQKPYAHQRGLRWALQCAEGVAYLHNKKPRPVLHRDLKPQNLLLTNNYQVLKICDFGTVVELKTKMTTNRGTPCYMAPEVFEGRKYTEKCDVFSWSIILWEILMRKKHYSEIGSVHAVQHQTRIGLRLPMPIEWSDSIKNLISSSWHGTPEKRPSMNDLVTFLKSHIEQGIEVKDSGFDQNSTKVEHFIITPTGQIDVLHLLTPLDL